MGLFEQFPYTNFHDLNLDALLKKVEELEALKQAIAEVNALAVELRAEMDVIKEQMAVLESLYTGFAAQIQQQFNNLAASMNDNFVLFKNDVQGQIDGFQGEIDDLEETLTNVLNNLPTEIEMLSPITGEMTDLVTIINQLANVGRTESLTAIEYDALAKTATAYDAYGLTAYQYDWEGKTRLV